MFTKICTNMFVRSLSQLLPSDNEFIYVRSWGRAILFVGRSRYSQINTKMDKIRVQPVSLLSPYEKFFSLKSTIHALFLTIPQPPVFPPPSLDCRLSNSPADDDARGIVGAIPPDITSGTVTDCVDCVLPMPPLPREIHAFEVEGGEEE